MTIVKQSTALVNQSSAVRLAEYAQIIGYPECNFFGVNADIDTGFQCREIWTKNQRDLVAYYLAEAQDEIENEIGYFLSPKWTNGQQFIDWQSYRNPTVLRYAYFIAAGVEGNSDISLGEAVDNSTDPAVIGPVATTVTDETEIRVYHPGLDVEIDPSGIIISGGNVTIEIPRCRLVKQSVADNLTTGLDYDDLTNFESAVDIKRVYNDTSTDATFVYQKCNDCTDATKNVCIYPVNTRLSIVNLPLGNCQNVCGCYPSFVKLNYYSGLQTLPRQAKDTIIRLAHSKMPNEPCGCAVVKMLWQRDNNVPDVLTAERLNCPFGISDGAWIAWKFAQSMKIMRGSKL